jgi:hypothetical protein
MPFGIGQCPMAVQLTPLRGSLSLATLPSSSRQSARGSG